MQVLRCVHGLFAFTVALSAVVMSAFLSQCSFPAYVSHTRDKQMIKCFNFVFLPQLFKVKHIYFSHRVSVYMLVKLSVRFPHTQTQKNWITLLFLWAVILNLSTTHTVTVEKTVSVIPQSIYNKITRWSAGLLWLFSVEWS